MGSYFSNIAAGFFEERLTSGVESQEIAAVDLISSSAEQTAVENTAVNAVTVVTDPAVFTTVQDFSGDVFESLTVQDAPNVVENVVSEALGKAESATGVNGVLIAVCVGAVGLVLFMKFLRR